MILGASLAAQAQVRQTISVQELYNSYNAKPVNGTISVKQLQAESTPVAGTISVKQLLAESAPVAGIVSVRDLQQERNVTGLPVNVSTSLPRIAPELALHTFFRPTPR